MTRPTDETLVAYVDGELSSDEAKSVEAYLAGDAQAREIVTALRRAGEAAHQAFEIPADRPMPKSLEHSILSHPLPTNTLGAGRADETPDPAGARVLPWRARSVAASIRSRAWAMPIAASVLLAVGLGSGYLAGRYTAGQQPATLAVGQVTRGSPLANVLETQPTGSVQGRFTVAATFRDKSRRPCREVELLDRSTSQPEQAAVACRMPGGTWMIEGAARIASRAATGTGFEPSGISERDALDGLLGLLGAGPVMSATDEAALLRRGWTE